MSVLSDATDLLKKLREEGDLVMMACASIAAILVVTAIDKGERPSALLGGFAQFIGLAAVARWMTVDAPAFLAAKSHELQVVCLLVAVLWVGITAAIVLGRGWVAGKFADEAGHFFGSRGAATVWILLLIACQQGPIFGVASSWWGLIARASGIAIAVAAGGGILHLVLRRFGLEGITRWLIFQPLRALVRCAWSVFLMVSMVVLTAAFVPLALVGWFFAAQRQRPRAPANVGA
ncbi:hypothetical protein ACIPY5_15005 [Microbacterium sp. NPDC089698]|uniref:hypothetical protein n=1 Tax=Microbacterium sp. NPDC089698 TaxID=3364200 RepID=UPI003813637C